MRLLNTSTLVLHSFVQEIPPYVILSHTWGDGEVIFDDIHQDYAKDMQGYSKIVKCCEQAVNDGYEWVWIDTCCIDKRSSAELSEAINSMYTWYWDAEICYAYLADLTGNKLNTRHNSEHPPRWFSRGWCLQELLAPEVVEFYNAQWVCVGTKSSLVASISTLTGIEERYLLDRGSIQLASIATRFSWASRRSTTRTEDIAYCLLGLVDVNMPLLYGEGDRAFYRLQLELIQNSNEQTIFAWNPQDVPDHHWKGHDRLGLLASHPCAFKNSSGINIRTKFNRRTFGMTNTGLQMPLPLLPRNVQRSSRGNQLWVGKLNCHNRSGEVACIFLEPEISTKFPGDSRCFRVRDAPLLLLRFNQDRDSQWTTSVILGPGWIAPLASRVPESSSTRLMRVNLPSASISRFTLLKIELDPAEEIQPQPVPDQAHDECPVVHLPNDASGGFLFTVDESKYLLALGSHDKTIWSALVPVVERSSSTDVLRSICAEVRIGYELWKYLGDYRIHHLPNQASARIVVHAKKTVVKVPDSVAATSAKHSSTIWDTTIKLQYRESQPRSSPTPDSSLFYAKVLEFFGSAK